MLLDLYPTTNPCSLLRRFERLEGVSVDWNTFVCPLESVDSFLGMLESRCVCRGEFAARFLNEVGEDISDRMYKNYSPLEAIDFGYKLMRTAEQLRKVFTRAKQRAQGQVAQGKLNCIDDASIPGNQESWDQLMEQVDNVELTGRWYVVVGQNDSGVRAYY